MIKLLAFVAISMMFSIGSFAADNKPTNNSQKGPIIIDVRTEQEYNTEHIKDAKLIPYDVISQKIAATVPSKDTKIILYCRSGRRSGIAQRTLIDMGYKNVENYGSMQEAKTKLGIK